MRAGGAAQQTARADDARAQPRGRVLVVDDSVVARAVLSRVIASSELLEVVGSVPTAAAALAFLADHAVDLVVLDIQMPGRDGLNALPDLLLAGAGAKILIVSSSAGEGAAATIKALALGAADTLIKPISGERAQRFETGLIEKLERLLTSPLGPIPCIVPVPSSLSVAMSHQADAFDIVAICASTGGIHALSRLLKSIPATFATPILVTQHLPASFMPYFAAQLAALSGRPCEVATDRVRVRPGHILVAPGDAHLRLVSIGDGACAVRLSTEPAGSACLPSADPMFESLIACYGARALAIVLSGMGRDGRDGARKLVAAGGCVIAQDEASSVVWGMPGAVASVASALLDPATIGLLIASGRRPLC